MGILDAPLIEKRTVSKTVAPTGVKADYNTTGSTAHTTLNTAITAVNAAGGGAIVVRAGAYTASGTVVLKSNVTVIFEPGSTWTLANGTNADAFGTGSGGVSNITLAGLTLAGNAANQTSGSGVNIQNFANITLEKLTLNNVWRNGINIDGTGGVSKNLVVRGCVIDSNGLTISTATGANGISITNNPSKVLIQGNYVTNSGSANIAIEGVGTRITIDDNFCDTSGLNSLAVADNITGYDHSNNHITVTNNQCYNSGNHSMHFAGSDIIVTSNQLDTSVQDGIRIASTGNVDTVHRFLIANNSIRNSGNNGIYVLNADDGLMGGNIISGQAGSPIVTDSVTYTALGLNTGLPTIDFGRSQTTGTPTATNIKALGAKVGTTDTNGSALTFSSGIATGNGNSTIIFQTVTDNQGAGTTDRTATEKMRLLGSVNGRILLGTTTTTGAGDGLNLGATVARVVQMLRQPGSVSAGNTLTVKAGGSSPGGTNLNGGGLILKSGETTGTGVSAVSIQTPDIGSSGTADNTYTTRVTVSSTGVDVASNKITSLATPTASTDAANKGYVDGVGGGASRTVTKTIATASSGYSADYYTTGTNDQTVIQTALAAVNTAGGGEVHLRAGTYNISATITIPYNNITLSGEGPGATKLFLTNHVNTHAIVAGADSLTYYSNIVVKDLYLDGNLSNQDQNVGASIYVESIGIEFIGVSYGAITNVRVDNFCKYGICIAHPTGGDSKLSSHNRVENSAVNGNYFDGIVVNFAHYNTVVGCSAQGAVHAGIYSKGSNGTVISGNDCSVNANGILLQYAGGCTVTGNSCIDNRLGGSGLSVFEVGRSVISNNTIENSSFDGLRLNAVHDSIIIGNTANANGQSVGSSRNGIHLLFASGGDDVAVTAPTGNIITGNSAGNYTGVGTNQLYGLNINAATAANNNIFGNYFNGNTTAPIRDIGSNNRFFNNYGASDFTLTQLGSPTADFSFNSKKLTSLATPTVSTDAATKGYVDTLAGTTDRTVTKTVAPAGVAADYNTDGTADESEINTAITAVSGAGGGEVVVRAGSYTVAIGINGASNVTLRFEKGATITLVAGSSLAGSMFNASSVTNFKLVGGKFDGNSSNNTATARGITFTDAVDSSMEDVTVLNWNNHAINVRGTSSKNVEVRNIRANNITNNGAGVCVSSGATYTIVDRVRTITAANSGVYVTGANNTRITDSYSEATYYGFDVFDSLDCTLDNCQVVNPTYDQFHIEDSQNITYTKCVGTGGTRDGMAIYSSNLSAKLAQDITIADCDFKLAPHYGINLPGTSSYNIKNVTIANTNVTSSVGYGIYATYTDGLTINGGILDTNGGVTYDGIRIDVNTTNVGINGVQIKASGATPIRLMDSTVSNVVISDNTYISNTVTAPNLGTATYVRMSGNTYTAATPSIQTSSSAASDVLLKFNLTDGVTPRAWQFQQDSGGAAAALSLKASSGDKKFTWRSTGNFSMAHTFLPASSGSDATAIIGITPNAASSNNVGLQIDNTGTGNSILLTDGTSTVFSVPKTGVPSAATDATTKSYVDTAVAGIVNSAPAALDTLNELAAALGNDASFATTVTTSLAGKEPTITAGTTGQYWRGDKSWQTLDKTAVGLANVDNTSDANKPVSTAQATAIALKQDASTAVTLTGSQTLANKTLTAPAITSPTGIVKGDVGLGSVDNTSDAAKPVSTATQTALNAKATKGYAIAMAIALG
jgi:parallel beta-helix repeat protein